MDRTTDKRAPGSGGDGVLMYPDNKLMPQVRPFSETLSAFTVIKEAFFTKESKAQSSK
jgi:hypothetical protein